MRTIKFRGKRKNWNPEYGQSEWMLGNLLNDKSIGEVGYGMDSYVYAEVIPETVGQFTGLTDKNGKEIFEGDVVKIGETECVETIRDIRYMSNLLFQHLERKIYLNIISNIHDNPELLK